MTYLAPAARADAWSATYPPRTTAGYRMALRRDERFAESRWDEPFWHVVRMLLDVLGGRRTATTADAVMAALRGADTDAARGLLGYLRKRDDVPERLGDYLAYRSEAGARLEQ